MSDIMLHGVLNMPLPDDPKEIGVVDWMQFRDRSRQASRVIQDQESQIEALAIAVAALTKIAVEPSPMAVTYGVARVGIKTARDALTEINRLKS